MNGDRITSWSVFDQRRAAAKHDKAKQIQREQFLEKAGERLTRFNRYGDACCVWASQFPADKRLEEWTRRDVRRWHEAFTHSQGKVDLPYRVHGLLDGVPHTAHQLKIVAWFYECGGRWRGFEQLLGRGSLTRVVEGLSDNEQADLFSEPSVCDLYDQLAEEHFFWTSKSGRKRKFSPMSVIRVLERQGPPPDVDKGLLIQQIRKITCTTYDGPTPYQGYNQPDGMSYNAAAEIADNYAFRNKPILTEK